MFFAGGHTVKLSRFRRLVTDLMHFSAKVPSIIIERRMDLAAAVAARRRWNPRPSWCAMFTKAFAVVAAHYPELRRSYMTFPWPRLYEHPVNVATINLERETPEEKIVIYAHLTSPETHSLADVDAFVRDFQDRPLEQILEYKRARRMSMIPWPFRRLVWWGGLNISGGLRAHNFGTFGISSTAAQGAGLVKLIPLLTATIHYGMFDEAGRIDMRLSFDHRVLDGAVAARALTEMEEVMNGEILRELRGLDHVAAAA